MNRIKQSIITLMLLSFFSQATGEENLYQQLGGQEAVERITKNLLDRILVNPKIDFLFADTDREDLHIKIVNQVCMETGGPCKYEGLDMIEAHSGMDIKNAEMDIFVEDFILAMEDADIPFRLQNKVLAIFAPMRAEITYK